MLRIVDGRIVDQEGSPIMLRGVGLGGWMNMENFITGFPANEEAMRAALRAEMGEEKYEFLFDRFLQYFFEDPDAAYLASLGLNVVRLPINYRHFESDDAPFEIKEEGFRHLDRVIEICARHGLYTIIDLHAVQGYQNQDWHCDNPTHKTFLWTHRLFVDRAAHLWKAIAARYRGNHWVAGYNLINEPNDTTDALVGAVTDRLYRAVKEADPDHLVFIDGNGFGNRFECYGDPLPDTVYSAHDYAWCGFINGSAYPGQMEHVWCDRAWLLKHYTIKSAYMRKHNVPLWIGEFGPIYQVEPEIESTRYDLVRDQVGVYDEHEAHWSLWTYKDIGMMGLVYLDPKSPYMELIAPILRRKEHLGADTWTGLETEITEVMGPFRAMLSREFPNASVDVQGMASRLVRTILFAEALLPEYAALFRGMSFEDLDRLMGSFTFANCIKREQLARVLAESSAAMAV